MGRNLVREDEPHLTKPDQKRILYILPDLSEREIRKIRAAVLEAYYTTDRFGRRRSMRVLALLFGVSLRTIAYACYPGILRDLKHRAAGQPSSRIGGIEWQQ